MASYAKPPVIDPSPIIAPTLKSSFFCLLASASPKAAEIEVEACPAPITSYSLSDRLRNPLNPSYCLIVGN